MDNLWDVRGTNGTTLPPTNGTMRAPRAEYGKGNAENEGCDFSPERLQPRLDTLLMVLKSCKGDVCVHPWKTIHPLGNVNTLKDAMSPEFDAFYASQPKISFSECAMGYFPSSEGPQRALPFIPREMT